MQTRAIEAINERLEDLDPASLRYQVLERAKRFKTSWIELGQMIYVVWKDKHWRSWGFLEFESYCLKELGIRMATARKLLHSYRFLEEEAPEVLKHHTTAGGETTDATCPSYDAVYVLKTAKERGQLPRADYEKLREKVLDRATDAPTARKELRLMQERLESERLNPQEARAKRRQTYIRRLVGTLKTTQTVARAEKLLPADVLKEVEALMTKLEAMLDA